MADSWTYQAADGDEDTLEEFDYKNQKDALLFCIEISPSMLVKDEAGSCPARTALESAYSVLQERIISSYKDVVGIMLYGCAKQTDKAFGGCYMLLDLDVPDAGGIKQVRELLDSEADLAATFAPAAEPVSMANVLFYANQQFTRKTPSFVSRRLFLVTDNDCPHEGDAALQKSTRTRATDLFELGIRIEPFFIQSPDHPFDPYKFYASMLSAREKYVVADNDKDAGELVPISSLDGLQIKSAIKSRQTPRHAVFTVPLELSPGLSIGVKGYVMYKRQQPGKATYVYTGERKWKVAKSVSKTYLNNATPADGGTAVAVKREDIHRGFKFGGEILAFTDEEIASFRHFSDPVIRIVGFRPRDAFQPKDNMRPAYFLYPSEEDYVGSVRTFAALHEVLLDEDKMAVAWMVPTTRGAPSQCLLVPSREVVETHNGRPLQVAPAGLYAVPLPYADDVREYPPKQTNATAPDEAIDRARTIIDKLLMPKGYQPERYPNPALQWHYRILQALALDEDLPAEPEDFTLPKYKSIYNRTHEAVLDWREAIDNFMGSGDVVVKHEPKKSVLGKRKAAP
ncbi:SPOC like C-terminal domain-containing protein [Dipodascopsis tothii]|uniref:SPOC like C-terminal domain-containing protein n=1 Tax=Dipodascopsis tothii TaxID=44089 RepID=UPI0034CD6CBC